MTTFEKLFGDKFSKFRLGQLLFITAITFGLFSGDIIRIVLGIFSLFCLSRENFKFTPWTKEQKITGWLLALFCVWMIIIPIIFGENQFPVRLRDAVRPIELTLWICITFLFAKDIFFIRNLKNFSIAACFCYAIVALVWCVQTKFALDYGSWPILKGAHTVGALFVGFCPWIIAQFLSTRNKYFMFFSITTFLLSIFIIICTRYTTFWIAGFAETITAFGILSVFNKKLCYKFSVIFTIMATALAFISFSTAAAFPSFKIAIETELNQISIFNNNIDHFTNKRYELWCHANRLIRQKPIVGYGRDTFPSHSLGAPHPHNTLLTMSFENGIPFALTALTLWFTIFLLALKNLFKNRRFILSFVTILAMTGFFVAGLAENLYMNDVCTIVLYWTIFATMLILYDNVIF